MVSARSKKYTQLTKAGPSSSACATKPPREAFVCSEANCNKTVRCNDRLRHAQTHLSEDKKEWLACPFSPCTKKVAAWQRNNLYGHIRSIHTREELVCKECSFSTFHDGSMSRHYRHHHKAQGITPPKWGRPAAPEWWFTAKGSVSSTSSTGNPAAVKEEEEQKVSVQRSLSPPSPTVSPQHHGSRWKVYTPSSFSSSSSGPSSPSVASDASFVPSNGVSPEEVLDWDASRSFDDNIALATLSWNSSNPSTSSHPIFVQRVTEDIPIWPSAGNAAERSFCVPQETPLDDDRAMLSHELLDAVWAQAVPLFPSQEAEFLRDLAMHCGLPHMAVENHSAIACSFSGEFYPYAL